MNKFMVKFNSKHSEYPDEKIYKTEVGNLKSVQGTGQEIVFQMVSLLNEYKQYVELNLIFVLQRD